MSGTPLIDRAVAERVAGATIAGLGLVGARAPGHAGYSEAEVEAACAAAIALGSELSGLGPVVDRPRAELVDRRTWASNALTTIAEAAAAVQARATAGLGLAGPLGPVAIRVVAMATGAEAGAAAGYAAGRVLGQYDLPLFESSRPARMLFVADNLAVARRELDADRDLFLRWIALHETTHVLQLQGVGWLAEHVRALAYGLLDAAAAGLERSDLVELTGRIVRAPRELIRAALRGELARLLADPAQRRALDRLQATMSVIEGHAEHVMDAAAPQLGAGVIELRRRLDRRRANRGGLGEIVSRLLGLELKMRQYERGKRFCDEVVAQGGETALALVWRSPGDLPDLAEIEHPRRWFDRVAAQAAV